MTSPSPIPCTHASADRCPASMPRLAALALSLWTSAVLAGPSQGSISLPGGFATACASQISSSSLLPGWDITAHFASFPGKYACQSQSFSGPAGQASASAAWAAPDLANESALQVRMGAIHLSAQNDAPGGYTYLFPVGVATGGWGDRLRVDLPGQEGKAAVWRFEIDVSGLMDNAGAGAGHLELTSFKDRVELRNDVPGYSRGNSDARTTELQRVGYGARYGADRTVLDVVTFAVPVVVGTDFDWGVFASLQAGASSYGASPSRSTALADFSHTLSFAGSAGLFINGVEQSGWSMSSASGVDWLAAAPVPEPGSWALLLGGLGLLGLRRSRTSSAQVNTELSLNMSARSPHDLALAAKLSTMFGAALLGSSLHAAPRHQDVTGPGGFMSSCAAPSTSSSGGAGTDITGGFATGHCTSAYFSGNGTATTSDGYSAGGINNSTWGSVGIGHIHLRSANDSPNSAYFALATSNGGFEDRLTLNLPGQTGQTVYMLVDMSIDGSLAAAGFAGSSGISITAFRDVTQLSAYTPGYSIGNSDPFSRSTQSVSWSVASGPDVTRVISDGHWVFSVPVVVGTAFDLGIYAQAYSSQRSQSAYPGNSNSQLDFGNSVLVQGVSGLLVGGQLVTEGYTLTAASGLDWTQPLPVPEPATWALMLAGIGAVVVRRRRLQSLS